MGYSETPTTIGNPMFTILMIIVALIVVGVVLVALGMFIDMRAAQDPAFRIKRDELIEALKN
jgi:hypothetical protein